MASTCVPIRCSYQVITMSSFTAQNNKLMTQCSCTTRQPCDAMKLLTLIQIIYQNLCTHPQRFGNIKIDIKLRKHRKRVARLHSSLTRTLVPRKCTRRFRRWPRARLGPRARARLTPAPSAAIAGPPRAARAPPRSAGQGASPCGPLYRPPVEMQQLSAHR